MRRLATVLIGSLLLLAACGGESGPTPEQQVRSTLSELGKATAAKDYDRLCGEILAPELVEQVASIGLPCAVALRQGLGEVNQPRLTVGKVTVTGERATAVVRTSAEGQQPSQDTVQLTRTKGRWRVASLGTPGAATPTPTPAP